MERLKDEMACLPTGVPSVRACQASARGLCLCTVQERDPREYGFLMKNVLVPSIDAEAHRCEDYPLEK